MSSSSIMTVLYILIDEDVEPLLLSLCIKREFSVLTTRQVLF